MRAAGWGQLGARPAYRLRGMSDSQGASILLGPRGRRLCMVVAERSGGGGGDIGEALFHTALDPADERKRRELVRLLGGLDPAHAVAATGEQGLMGALGDSAAAAMYWQEPDEEDSLLTDQEFVAALRPLARAIEDAPETGWWSADVAPEAQVYVQWMEGRQDKHRPPPTRAPAEALRAWKAEAVKDEHDARSFPEDSSVIYSGIWWSTPPSSGLPVTSRALPWLGAAQLMAVEDGAGWARARVWPMRMSKSIRSYEITGPQAWTDLVGRYPLRVSRARRHDWERATGRAAEWYIPDWEAVAADFDAVHLTVTGYLATAGRALDVSGTAGAGDTGQPHATVLAGWDPDTTYWLTGSAGHSDSPTDWELRDGDGDGSEDPVWVRVVDRTR